MFESGKKVPSPTPPIYCPNYLLVAVDLIFVLKPYLDWTDGTPMSNFVRSVEGCILNLLFIFWNGE